MEISLEIYRSGMLLTSSLKPNPKQRVDQVGWPGTFFGGRGRGRWTHGFSSRKMHGFLLESSPFQDPGDPGDSHGYPNSVRGNNRA